MVETEEFNTLAFEKKLMHLKDTQESIQALSAWCLKQREHHKKIVISWLNVLKRVKVEQRLVLFYLANDVIQYSKRKKYEFVESWGLNLQKATPLVRDEKVRHKILRIFKIWGQRSVYDDEFLSDLTGLLSAGAIKKTDDDPLDFQPQQLVNKIKQCTVLESDTDLRLKYIHESHLELSDADALCTSLKDRSNKDDVEKELNEGIACVERYTQALQREIVARETLLALLSSASQYYSTQRGEVKVVAYAYKNFGGRVRALKRKLDELIPTLPSAAPPSPPREQDVPSPGPDEDLDLPATADAAGSAADDVSYDIDKTFNTSFSADGSLYNLGLSSFLTSDSISIFNDSSATTNNNGNKIEVISSRPNEKQNFNINDFLKTLLPSDNSISQDGSASSGTAQPLVAPLAVPAPSALPTEELPNPPPPTSFYGSLAANADDLDQPYHPEVMSPWNNNSWNIGTQAARPVPPVPVPAPVFAESPASPPPAPAPIPPPAMPDTPIYIHDLPSADVDHRGVLPPPPPPPVLPLLTNVEDVDHRRLPSAAVPPPRLASAHQDVDHRNLIPLTQPPAQRHNTITVDQDYRVPPPGLLPPTDIVESVDMDLSEDEDQQNMFASQQSNQIDMSRRHPYNNNKVLVGGHNGKTNLNDAKHSNLIRINSSDEYEDKPKLTAPPPPPLLVNTNIADEPSNIYNMLDDYPLSDEENVKVMSMDEDLESAELRNPSPPVLNDFSSVNFLGPPPRPFMGQGFPGNWGARTNFRPPMPPPQQFWPRNNQRWGGPRFW